MAIKTNMEGKVLHNIESGIAWLIGPVLEEVGHEVTVIQSPFVAKYPNVDGWYTIGAKDYLEYEFIREGNGWIIVNSVEVFKVLYGFRK